jgi:hypothetical protein
MFERSTGGSRPIAIRPGLRLAASGIGAVVCLAMSVAVGGLAIATLLGSAGERGPIASGSAAWLTCLVPLVLLIASFGGGIVAGFIAGTGAPDHGIATWALTGVAGVAIVLIVALADPALGRLGHIPLPSLQRDAVLVEVVAILCLAFSLTGSITGARLGVTLRRGPARRSPDATRSRPGRRSARRP